MDPEKVQIEESWKKQLSDEFSKDYFDQIKSALLTSKSDNKTIYPPGKLMFNAFNQTSFENVKVVILGQDPYHGPGEAMGLCFSVPKEIRKPPSLNNVFKELRDDLGIPISSHGDLTSWAKQGVFLLNAMLSVEHKKPGSHKNLGWQTFTDAVISTLSNKREGLIFLLWGRFAQSKQPLIDESKHHVLCAAHPSPLARGAFFGNKHFSRTNTILESQYIEPINWQLEDY